jgi:hypothetical protein
LLALISGADEPWSPADMVRTAYHYADALIEAR